MPNFLPLISDVHLWEQILLVISIILWVISGILTHPIWGHGESENEGIANEFQQSKSQVEGGLSKYREIKIIEIIDWCIAGVSVLATTCQQQVIMISARPQVYVGEIWNQMQAADGPGSFTSNLGPGRDAKDCCEGWLCWSRPTNDSRSIL